jgi:hypothetical protein
MNMQPESCPFLGLEDDPKTKFALPTPGNFCHKARRKTAVAPVCQQKFCLTEDFSQCPVYSSDEPADLSADCIVKINPLDAYSRKKPYPWIVLGVIFVSLMILLVLMLINDSGRNQIIIVQETPDDLAMVVDTSTAGSATPTRMSLISGETEDGSSLCPPPAGWQPYAFTGTDSLTRLSILYSTDIDVLKAANCLGDLDTIQAGQVIFVPGATPTPRFTHTSTPTKTRTRVIVPAASATEAPARPAPKPTTAPVIPPTAVPPTAVPPTQVPPTAEPVPTKDPNV